MEATPLSGVKPSPSSMEAWSHCHSSWTYMCQETPCHSGPSFTCLALAAGVPLLGKRGFWHSMFLTVAIIDVVLDKYKFDGDTNSSHP